MASIFLFLGIKKAFPVPWNNVSFREGAIKERINERFIIHSDSQKLYS